jgi:hypothetical protein
MIKLFVTYRCNLACPYCFAREMAGQFPRDMDRAAFERLLEWMVQAGITAAAFIGGEPTLHPGISRMIEDTARAGISVVLFTNGLFPPALARELSGRVANFVVNYNDPAGYPPAQAALLHENLAALRDMGARLTFSKNFSPESLDYGYLLEAVRRYGVRSVRYDISRPSVSATNEHFRLADTGGAMAHIVGFVRACEALGVRTGLDCSLRLCDVRDEDRRYLERVSMKFTGVCHPSIDVHPDLSASYCLPLREVQVPDVTVYPDEESLMGRLAQAARPLRQGNVTPGCLECKDFMRRCQGGCLALGAARGLDGRTQE